MLCTNATKTSNMHDKNTDRCRPNATPAVGILIRVIIHLTIAFNYRILLYNMNTNNMTLHRLITRKRV